MQPKQRKTGIFPMPVLFISFLYQSAVQPNILPRSRIV